MDVEGEYFGLNKRVNCMPEILKRQLDYGMSQGIDGICVRVDRGKHSVRNQPSEVNLWALGLLASGRATTVDQIWKAWATRRYGPEAGLAVIPILRHTTNVLQQALYIENFSFFDPRTPLGSAKVANPFRHNSNPHRWSDEYKPIHQRLIQGDPAAIMDRDPRPACRAMARRATADK